MCRLHGGEPTAPPDCSPRSGPAPSRGRPSSQLSSAADGLRASRCLRLCLCPGPGLPTVHPPLGRCAPHREEDRRGGVFPGGTRQWASGGVHFASGCLYVRPVFLGCWGGCLGSTLFLRGEDGKAAVIAEKALETFPHRAPSACEWPLFSGCGSAQPLLTACRSRARCSHVFVRVILHAHVTSPHGTLSHVFLHWVLSNPFAARRGRKRFRLRSPCMDRVSGSSPAVWPSHTPPLCCCPAHLQAPSGVLSPISPSVSGNLSPPPPELLEGRDLV